MFGPINPNPGPFDLQFRLLGFPVRVDVMFWLFTAIMGNAWLRLGVQFLLLWVAVVFVSILVHELGHAVFMRLHGARARIVLHSFGGQAIADRSAPSRGRRIAVALAGPGAGFLLLGLVWGSNELFHWTDGSLMGTVAYRMLWFVNLGWGLINLLPVLPLDGGHVCQELCGGGRTVAGQRLALQISLATALLAVSYGIAVAARASFLPPWAYFGADGIFMAILFGMLAFQSYQALDELNRQSRGGWGEDRFPWQQ